MLYHCVTDKTCSMYEHCCDKQCCRFDFVKQKGEVKYILLYGLKWEKDLPLFSLF